MILLPQLRQCIVKHRRQLFPVGGFGFIYNRLHLGLLFAALAAALNRQGIGGSIAGGAAKPAGQNCLLAEQGGFARKDDEYRLRHFFREMRVAHSAHCHGINQVNVPLHQRGKSRLGLIFTYSRTSPMSSGIIYPYIYAKAKSERIFFAWIDECEPVARKSDNFPPWSSCRARRRFYRRVCDGLELYQSAERHSGGGISASLRRLKKRI